MKVSDSQLAMLSTMSYGAPYDAELLEEFESSDFVVRAEIANEDAEAVVYEYGDTVVVAFRGTSSATDFLRDMKAWKVHLEPYKKARVHAGFLAHYSKIRELVAKEVKTTERLIVTGHSLGGAVAQLAALELSAEHCVTFGGPRVGNLRFAGIFNHGVRETRRYVKQNDAIPRTPKINFWHAHPQTYIAADGRVVFNPGWWFEKFDRMKDMWRGKRARELLADHSSVGYWRALRAAEL